MMRNIKIAIVWLLIGLTPVLISGCATPAAQTGFLKDYSNLKPHPDIDGRHRYINPNINIGDYSNFMVDPVAVNLSDKGKERGIDQEKLGELAQYFHQQIVEQLEIDYRVVKSGGPGVARVRASISDIVRTKVALNIHPGTKMTGVGLGEAGMEAEVVDSVTGKTIAAAIDHQSGSRLDILGGLQFYGNAKSIMDNWAEDLKKFIDKAHGKLSE
ncbi:MAG: DUF3313 family protein [Nitrospirales bacterium]|nr:DUF3313 family protein [Nitrospirales bacterium]